jgi:hypothetical protein
MLPYDVQPHLQAEPLTYDVHQHLLTEPLIYELARRAHPPALDHLGGGWTFRVAGEPDTVLSFEATDVDRRREALEDDRIDQALIALSSALGIETLPGDEARILLDAHHAGIEALGPGFGGWGAVQLETPDPADGAAAIARGCVGISLPAAALADPDGVERLGPLLAELESLDAPLFVHPGPVSGDGPRPGSVPEWWPALTDYVSQMQAAWFAFNHVGRAAHPRLRVLFAMQAGGAPLHLERYAARSGDREPPAPDPLVFYDNSSYGPRMLEAMIAAVGVEQIVYGSDQPVVDTRPPLPDAELGRALRGLNPHRLLTPRAKGDPL